ncbi:restriction endonuclease subunit S [Candidatus Clostridium radicumherbarum]|uniref:Restriction endonuclease subunit S n=1 Tax=Candidatus Clostridium radicumherbarum TaxID=3381662 RepID=A0ABW8TV03_9CLOT
MIEKKKTPRIRFAGFTDAWEQRKFDELADYKKGPFGSALTKDMFVPKGNDNVKVYEQQNAINKDWKLERYFIPKDYAIKMNSFKVLAGDIIVSCAGTIGEIYVLPMDAETGIINQALMRVRVKEDIVEKKLFIYLFSNMIESFSKIHSNGSAMKNIPPFSDLKPMLVNVPTKTEQRKLISLLIDLDKLITLHQRKYNKLEVMKKSMLEKMFPKSGSNIPEIRFAGFTDAWEQRKFSDITYLAGEKNRNNIPYQSYSISNEKGFIPQDEQFENGGTMKEADKSMYLIVQPNSFAYNPARINVGSIGYYDLPENVIVSSLYEVFKTSDDIDDRFLWHWFKSDLFPKFIERYQEGGVRMYFYYNKLCMCSLDLPSIEEQRKIGKYFDKFDNLITLHQRKLEKLKKIKKSMLEKMFI